MTNYALDNIYIIAIFYIHLVLKRLTRAAEKVDLFPEKVDIGRILLTSAVSHVVGKLSISCKVDSFRGKWIKAHGSARDGALP